MRKKTTVEIDGNKITVNEFTTSQVIDLIEDENGIRLLIGAASDMPSDFKKLVLLSVDMIENEFDEMCSGYGDYLKVEKAFREVNKDFLASAPARIAKIEKTALAIGRSSKALAGLSARDIQESSSADSPGTKK